MMLGERCNVLMERLAARGFSTLGVQQFSRWLQGMTSTTAHTCRCASGRAPTSTDPNDLGMVHKQQAEDYFPGRAQEWL
eukprot:10474138-Lingulodinium_polyedra.AAC.1